MKKKRAKTRRGKKLRRTEPKRVDRITLIKARILSQWRWIALFLILGAIVSSLLSNYLHSPTLYGNLHDIALHAATRGDYPLAQSLYSKSSADMNVLGTQADEMTLIYPTLAIDEEIARLERLNRLYQYSPQIVAKLSKLYQELGRYTDSEEMSRIYKILVPNN